MSGIIRRALLEIEALKRNKIIIIRTEEEKNIFPIRQERRKSFPSRKREEGWQVFLSTQDSGRMPAGRGICTMGRAGHRIPLTACFLCCKSWKESAESEKPGGRNETEEIISFELGICV